MWAPQQCGVSVTLLWRPLNHKINSCVLIYILLTCVIELHLDLSLIYLVVVLLQVVVVVLVNTNLQKAKIYLI